MKVMLFLRNPEKLDRSATTYVYFPESLSLVAGMKIHQTDDNDFIVRQVEVCIDFEPPQVILHLKPDRFLEEPTELEWDTAFKQCAKNSKWKVISR